MKKKKLFKITNSAYFQVRQLQGQLNYFSAYFDVIAVAPKGEGWEELQKQQARCIPVKMSRAINPIFDLITLFQLVKLFIKEKPTIVHSHTPKAGLLGMLAAWIARVPYAHGNRLPIDDGYGHKKTNSSFYGTVNLRLCHKCISQFTKDV